MILTVDILKNICKFADIEQLAVFVEPLNKSMDDFAITTILRARHFIAQIAHESGSFHYVQELASGEAYEGRKDLGNIYTGDGVKFKGRGLIQITGRDNYRQLSNSLFGNSILLNKPEILETPKFAVESACWFWQTHGLNELADADNIELITRRINGGLNGLKERENFYERTKKFII